MYLRLPATPYNGTYIHEYLLQINCAHVNTLFEAIKVSHRSHDTKIFIEYKNQCDATNTLKRFLIGQFAKFFLLNDPLNASKHL